MNRAEGKGVSSVDRAKEIEERTGFERADLLAAGLESLLGMEPNWAFQAALYLRKASEALLEVETNFPEEVGAKLQLGGAPLEVRFLRTGMMIEFNCGEGKRQDLGEVRIRHLAPLGFIRPLVDQPKAFMMIDKAGNAIGVKKERGNVSFYTGSYIEVDEDLKRDEHISPNIII